MPREYEIILCVSLRNPISRSGSGKCIKVVVRQALVDKVQGPSVIKLGEKAQYAALLDVTDPSLEERKSINWVVKDDRGDVMDLFQRNGDILEYEITPARSKGTIEVFAYVVKPISSKKVETKIEVDKEYYYLTKLRQAIDGGVNDIDELFQELCRLYAMNSKEWEAEDDVDDIIRAFYTVCGRLYGSTVAQDQSRWQAVRRSLIRTSKFRGEWDKWQHFVNGAYCSAVAGETVGWLAGWTVEKFDTVKRIWGSIWGTRKPHHIGFDWADFEWTAAGASFVEFFDQCSEKECKNLLSAFAKGSLALSAVYKPAGLSGGFGKASPLVSPGFDTNIDKVDKQIAEMETYLKKHK